MKIFKRIRDDRAGKKFGLKSGQFVPVDLEKHFPELPYHVRFKHQNKTYWIKLPGARNRREAEKMARAEYARVVHVDARYKHLLGEIPLSELIDRYKDEVRHKSSFLWIEVRCNQILRFFSGKKPIGAIRREDVIRLRNELKKEITNRGRERSSSDVNRTLEVLRALLNFAVDNEWLVANPIRRGVMLRAGAQTIRYFSDDEIDRLLESCTGTLSHLRPMIEFCLLTGCRTAEMLLLKWADVDFEGDRIHFRHTKTAHDRFVKMGRELRRLLYDLVRAEGCDYVFPNPITLRPYGHWSKKYKRFIPSFPRKAWSEIKKRAEITDREAVPYTFRRTAATILAKSLGLHEAREILGHSSITTTQKYAAVTSDTYDKAAEVLERRVVKRKRG